MKHIKTVSKPAEALMTGRGLLGKILDFISDLKGPVVS